MHSYMQERKVVGRQWGKTSSASFCQSTVVRKDSGRRKVPEPFPAARVFPCSRDRLQDTRLLKIAV